MKFPIYIFLILLPTLVFGRGDPEANRVKCPKMVETGDPEIPLFWDMGDAKASKLTFVSKDIGAWKVKVGVGENWRSHIPKLDKSLGEHLIISVVKPKSDRFEFGHNEGGILSFESKYGVGLNGNKHMVRSTKSSIKKAKNTKQGSSRWENTWPEFIEKNYVYKERGSWGGDTNSMITIRERMAKGFCELSVRKKRVTEDSNYSAYAFMSIVFDSSKPIAAQNQYFKDVFDGFKSILIERKK